MKRVTVTLIACLAIMTMQAQTEKPQPTNPSDAGTHYINPIVRADYPDPDVIRVGNTYCMVSTMAYYFPGAKTAAAGKPYTCRLSSSRSAWNIPGWLFLF